jgi:acyl-CoA synthetase (AMP-forming)/AMP-acid ligase II
MTETLREVIYKYAAEYLGLPMNPLNSYSDDDLQKLITEDELRMLTIVSTGKIKKVKPSKDAVIKDYSFHFSYTQQGIIVKAEDPDQAKKIFENMTVEEIGAGYRNYRIMNL